MQTAEISPRSVKATKLALLSGLVFGFLVVVVTLAIPASAQTVNFTGSARNCDSNAVIDCGALTVSELQTKYAESSSTQIIYSAFNITTQSIHNLTTDAVAGTVTKSGSVMVNGQVVATNALTAGRQNIPGSTMVTFHGVTFFERPPSVSFASDSLDAFVAMNSTHQFLFAILASCGNPVNASAVAPPATPAKPKSAVPAPAKPTPPTTVVQQQQTVIVQSQPVVQQTVMQTTPTAATQPQALPNTGPGAVLGLFLGTTTLGTLVSHFVLKRRTWQANL